MRAKALERRGSCSNLKRILVSMGGMDADNVTSLVLDSLACVRWDEQPIVDVVLGGNAPHIKSLETKIKKHKLTVNLLSDVRNMGELMLNADLAFGAGGSTSWERCCLGLPALTVITADNQSMIVSELDKAGAIINIGKSDSFDVNTVAGILDDIIRSSSRLATISNCAFMVCSGDGVSRCVKQMSNF